MGYAIGPPGGPGPVVWKVDAAFRGFHCPRGVDGTLTRIWPVRGNRSLTTQPLPAKRPRLNGRGLVRAPIVFLVPLLHSYPIDTRMKA